MRSPLTPRQREIVDLAGRLADVFAERAARHDREGSFPFDNYEDMRESGYLALTVPEELGGRGASLYEMLLAQERLAMGDGSTALAVNMHVNGMGMWGEMWRITRDPNMEDMLSRAARGELVWAGLASERGEENLMRDASTTATLVDGALVLNGRKVYCTNSLIATDYSITARLEDPDEGPQMLYIRVPANADGLTLEPNWNVMGMRSTQSIDLLIENVRVERSAILHAQPVGTFNEVVFRTTLGWGLSSFGAVYTGIARGAMEWAKEMVIKRGRKDDPLVQDLFARMEILLETSRSVMYRRAQEISDGLVYEQLSLQEIFSRASVAKIVPVNNALEIMRLIQDAVGGATFALSQPFERMWRDAQAGPVMPMTNIAARRIIGATAFDIELSPESEARAITGAVAR